MEIKISDIADGKLSDEQAAALQKYFKGGGTWQDLLKLHPDQVESVYARGYEFYNRGDFEQALGAFSALLQINPYLAKAWLAIGATLQAKKVYNDALVAYDLALTLEENNVSALFYSAQCAFALEMDEECKEFLRKVILSPVRHEEFSEKAQEILNLLEGKE